jgi:hypothetical protein
LLIPLYAEIVDRIAVTVDRQVITELQIEEELRVTAFLNDTSIARGDDIRRAAVDRLIAQLLVGREMQLNHYPAPAAADVDRYRAEVCARFSNAAEYEHALGAYQITDLILKQHLEKQLATLSFIELRFRPNLNVPDSEIESFYRREIATWQTDHPGVQPPSFATARAGILKILTEEHTNEILDTWLDEQRKHVAITYLDKSLE